MKNSAGSRDLHLTPNIIKRLRPGQPGTKRLQREQYGDRLLFVRHRQDAQSKRRVTTIIDEGPKPVRTPLERRPFPRPNQKMHVRIGYGETDLRAKVKAAGGIRDARRRPWVLPYATAANLRLDDRILAAAPDVD